MQGYTDTFRYGDREAERNTDWTRIAQEDAEYAKSVETWVIEFEDGFKISEIIKIGEDIMDNARRVCKARGNISIYEIKSITRIDE